MPRLTIYIREGCWNCEEAPRIVADVLADFPHIDVVFQDLTVQAAPAFVFATPTYVLDEQVISLGNPTRSALRARLRTSPQSGSRSRRSLIDLRRTLLPSRQG